MPKKRKKPEAQKPSGVNKLFGEYLIEKGLISLEQRDDALAIQNSINHRLGILASMEDILSVSQIFDVLSEQKDTGKPFGETARLLNLISDSQLSELLERQRGKRLRVGEILVGLLYLEKEEMEKELKKFSRAKKVGE
jgi:hypothetical protein